MNTLQNYQEGMTAFVAGDAERAIERLAPVSAASGGEGLIARYYLGQAHAHLGRRLMGERSYTRAAEQLASAARLLPQGGDLSAHLVRCLVKQQRFEEAAAELARRLESNPDDAQVRIQFALALCKSGESLRAIATLREGLERRPQVELYYHLGILAASTGDIAQAHANFESAVRRDPTHARALERLAQCCAAQGRHERALRYLESANQAAPDDYRIAWQLALAAQMHGPVTLAASTWRPDVATLDRLADALIREPDFIESFLSLPPSAVDQEVFRTLAATLQHALRHHAEYADLHFHCGQVFHRLANTGQAIASIENAVSINPRYVKALILLAQLYSQCDRCAEGIARLQMALRAGGDYPDVHHLMGNLYLRTGNRTLAKASFGRALELNSEYWEARAALVALAA